MRRSLPRRPLPLLLIAAASAGVAAGHIHAQPAAAGAASDPPVRAAEPPPPPPVVAMTPQQVETVLRARGYDRLEGLTRETPERYRLEQAERFGAPLPGPLAIDAVNATVVDEPPLTEAQVRTLLRARGYAEVPEVRRDGEAILARAVREGASVTLRIDPRTGAVRPQRE